MRRAAHRHVRGQIQRLARGVGQRVLRRLQRVGGAVGVGARRRLVGRDAQDRLPAVEGLAGVGDQALFEMAAEARVGDDVAVGVRVAGQHHHRVERAGLRGRALAILGVAGDAGRLLEARPGLAGLRGEDGVARLRVRAGEERRVEQPAPFLERLDVDAGDVRAGLHQVHLGLVGRVLLQRHQRAAGERFRGQLVRVPGDQRRIRRRPAEPRARARAADLVDGDVGVVVEAAEVGVAVVAGQEDAQLELDQVAGLQRPLQRRRRRDLLDQHELAVLGRHGQVGGVVVGRIRGQRVVIGERRLQLLVRQQAEVGQALHAAVVAVQRDGRRARQVAVAAADEAGAEVGAVQPPLRAHDHRQDVLRGVRRRDVVVDRDLVRAALEVVRREQVVRVAGAGRVGLLARMAVAHAAADLGHQRPVGERVLRRRVGLRPGERREVLRRGAAGASAGTGTGSRTGARAGSGAGARARTRSAGRRPAVGAAGLAAAAGREKRCDKQQGRRGPPTEGHRTLDAFHGSLRFLSTVGPGFRDPGPERPNDVRSLFVNDSQIPCPDFASDRRCRIEMKVSGRRPVEPVPRRHDGYEEKAGSDQICHFSE